MLPRWHIIFGALFTLLIWIVAPTISLWYLLLLFLSSFLIDVDHYAMAVLRTRKFSLFDAFHYHREASKREEKDVKKGIFRKGDFHIFHTLEFHLLIALLSIFWTPFFYIFIGMTFHSFLDIISLMRDGRMHRREFFLFNYMRSR